MKKLFFRSVVAAAMVAIGASATAIPRANAPRDVFRLPVSDRNLDAWRMQGDWNRPLQQAEDYDGALRFASCVRSFDPAAAEKTLAVPVTSLGYRGDLIKLAKQYRGCAARNTAVAPLLLRAAFAEQLLKRAAVNTRTSAVGVPSRIGSFPVGSVARCQVAAEPKMVANLFQTRPGEAAEEEIVRALFAATPQCLTNAGGAITPTAARLAIVEAALAAR